MHYEPEVHDALLAYVKDFFNAYCVESMRLIGEYITQDLSTLDEVTKKVMKLSPYSLRTQLRCAAFRQTRAIDVAGSILLSKTLELLQTLTSA